MKVNEGILLIVISTFIHSCKVGSILADDTHSIAGNNQSKNLRFELYPGFSGDKIFAEEIWPTKHEKRDTSGGVTEKCMRMLYTFSNSTTKFLRCVLTNARPLHYCENCVAEFSAVNVDYDAIADDEINGTTCEDELLRADNVQVVLLAYNFVQDVWEKSTCHNCYYTAKINDTTIYHATNETLNMLKKIQDTQECFNDFSHEDDVNMTVCFMCKDFYCQANTYYNELDNSGKLCSDLKDSMNYTRRMWSKEFHCTVAEKNDAAIYGIAVAVGFLPVILYLGAWVYGMHVEKRNKQIAQASSSARAPLNMEREEEEEE